MKVKKKFVLLLTVAVICLVASLLIAATEEQTEYTYKAVVDFSLYQQADFSSEKLATVPQNAKVNPIEEPFVADERTWQKVQYLELVGYTPAENVYLSNKNDSYYFTVAKVKANAMGESIPLYAVHNETASPVAYANDGEKVKIVDDGISYGSFVKVEYSGSEYFVRSINVTTGLSYNQTLAVIITASVLGGVLVVLFIVLLVRRRKRKV